MAKKGALASGPKFKFGATVEELEKQRIDPKNSAYRKEISSRLAQARKAQSAGQQPTGAEATPQAPNSFQQVNEQSNQLSQGLMDQIKNQGAFNYQGPQVQQFNPGDFQGMFDKAYESSLNRFNRDNQPIFDRQRSDFYQMAAERGWDPTSKDVANAYEMQVAKPQDMARQNAMDSAFNAGLGAQSQAYNQASNTFGQNLAGQNQAFGQYSTGYQMPYQMLGAFSPYYQGQSNYALQQGQQGWASDQAALDRQQQQNMENLQHRNRLSEIAAVPRGGGGGGGGGGLTYDQQLQLMREQSALNLNNAMIAGGYGGQQVRSGFGSGLASGIGAGMGALTGSILKS